MFWPLNYFDLSILSPDTELKSHKNIVSLLRTELDAANANAEHHASQTAMLTAEIDQVLSHRVVRLYPLLCFQSLFVSIISIEYINTEARSPMYSDPTLQHKQARSQMVQDMSTDSLRYSSFMSPCMHNNTPSCYQETNITRMLL